MTLNIVRDTKYLKLSKSDLHGTWSKHKLHYSDSPKKKKDYTTTFCTFVSNNMSVLWLYKRLTLFFFNWGGYMSVCEPCWSWGGSVNNNDYFGFFHLVELNHVQLFEFLKFQSFSILLMMFVLLIIYTVQDIINFCFQKI